MPIRSTKITPTTAMRPETSPITTAAHGATYPDARAEQQRPGERGECALVVHDGGAGEVLHPLREQPTVVVPDPVGRDRVDQREDDPEDEVHVQLRPLRHRAPDDRERHAREHDL